MYLYSRKSHSYITKAYTEPTRTDIVHGIDNVVNTISQFISNTKYKIDVCVDYTRPFLAIEINQLRNAFIDAKKRGVKIRYLTEITKDNLSYCKELMSLVEELRHLDGIKGSFYISEQEYAAPSTYHEKGKSADMMVHSTVKEIVEHQQYVFDTIWNTSTSAERKIKEIESEGGVSFGITEIIDHPLKTQELFINLIKSAKFEVLLVLPTVNAFMREYKIGAIQILKELSTNATQRGTPSKENLQKQGRRGEVSIRILTPSNDAIDKIIDDMDITTSSKLSREGEGEGEESIPSSHYSSNKNNNPLLQIRHLESLPKYNVTTVTILVVDRKASLVIEKVDDSKESFAEAVGLSTYSTSEPTVTSYVSIFENFWNQIELYQQAKEHNKMQKEFINIAAHELRTPIQSILGCSEMLEIVAAPEDNNINNEIKQIFKMLFRNTNRLQKLANDILDVTRIESNTLHLNKETFYLNEQIMNVIADIQNQINIHRSNNNVIKLLFEPKCYVFIDADRVKIYQVISNLLGNSIKFTKEGAETISITTEEKKKTDQGEVIVKIKDTGIGLSSDILPRIFSKFARGSSFEEGIGLGLFISKGIIEAHGGKIWAQNNTDGKGATFAFSLPLRK